MFSTFRFDFHDKLLNILQIFVAAFGAVDEPLAFCMMVHFWVGVS